MERLMEGQQVRKTISLKLREQPMPKVEAPAVVKEDEKELGVVTGGLPGARSEDTCGGVETDYSEYKWDHRLHLIGRPIKDPLLHLCEQCSLPVLIYGRMKRCRHAFCRDCAKRANGVCPHCKEAEQTFEEASMGSVYVCTYGGGRYNNKGCGRSYLSQRDLDAHVLYRHSKDKVSVSLGPSSHQAPPTSLPAGFTLPPFFQPGMLQGLPPPPPPPPPGFGSTLHGPPTMGGAVLRPPPQMLPGSLRPGGLGAVATLGVSAAMHPGMVQASGLPPGSLRPPTMVSSCSLRAPQSTQTTVPAGLLPPFPLPPSSIANAGLAPPSGGVSWTHPSSQ